MTELRPSAVVPDADARDIARTVLDVNLLVEAGAGSGKTTLMVDRVLTMLQAGVPTDAIAAVTFTRKAATELRERLEKKVDVAIEAAVADAVMHTRLRLARRELDRAYVGTIHGFCGRLLREQAIAAGVSPDFEEVEEGAAARVAREWYRRWVAAERGAAQEAVLALGIDPVSLLDAMLVYDAHPDVAFDATPEPAPQADALRNGVRALVQAARPLLPETPHENGWDGLQRTLRRLARLEPILDWNDLVAVARLAESLEPKSAIDFKVTRWERKRTAQGPAKALNDQAIALATGAVAEFLTAWRAHRYAPVLAFVRRAALAWREERARRDMLTFEDLLRVAAELLRERPDARRLLGERWRYLLVDEFQDTDPLQAEVCLLLASPPEQGSDWHDVTPRPGALFVVGDPKQSIYRFRRADIQTYEFVRQRFTVFGRVLRLTANFRSTRAIADVVNAHFATVFSSPTESSATQAVFAPMETVTDAHIGAGVARYTVAVQKKGKQAVAEADAVLIASFIRREVDAQRATFSDFMVLTAGKAELRAYASALAEFNIPAITSGAKASLEHELRELLILLDALAAPEDAVQVVAALEGLFVGVTSSDLYVASQRGIRFTIAEAPATADDAVSVGLTRLHRWYVESRQLSPAAMLDRLLDDTGLLAFTASQLLGDRRAGLLLGLVDALRDAAPDGGTVAALRDVLDATIADEDREYSLQPGNTRAVRVMNLHKAKGLEAPIVFLAASVAGRVQHGPDYVIHRDARTGLAMGVLRIDDARKRDVARPADWMAWVTREAAREAEERARLLYVATTRAAHSMFIGFPEAGESAWAALLPVLDARQVEQRVFDPMDSPGRERAASTPRAVRSAIGVADARRATASVGRQHHEAVTTEAKRALDDMDESPVVRSAAPRDPRRAEDGRAWGSAVHKAIEAALRLEGTALDARLAAIVWHEFEFDANEAARAERLDRLRGALGVAQRHPAWAQLTAGAWATEVPIAQLVSTERGQVLREGVIDAIRLDNSGWLVVDWKSDRVNASGWARVLPTYEQQVALYAEALRAISGRPAEGVVVHVAPA
jgi:ATP-dependent helicase/nuclease subunit A